MNIFLNLPRKMQGKDLKLILENNHKKGLNWSEHLGNPALRVLVELSKNEIKEVYSVFPL